MSRKRYISSNIVLDSVINRLAREYGDFAALLYRDMIPVAEDNATISGNVEELMGKLIPLRRDKTEPDVETALLGMCSCGLIAWDRTGNVIYFPIESFYRYQSYIKPANRRTRDYKTPDTIGSNCKKPVITGEVNPSPENSGNNCTSQQNAVPHPPSPSPSHSLSHSHPPPPNLPKDGNSSDDPSLVPLDPEMDVVVELLCRAGISSRRVAEELATTRDHDLIRGHLRRLEAGEFAKAKNPPGVLVKFIRDNEPLPKQGSKSPPKPLPSDPEIERAEELWRSQETVLTERIRAMPPPQLRELAECVARDGPPVAKSYVARALESGRSLTANGTLQFLVNELRRLDAVEAKA